MAVPPVSILSAFLYPGSRGGISRNVQRTVIPELLDSDSGSAEEVRAQLADLRRINRLFGGVHTTRNLIRRVLQRTHQTSLTILDVASASGDLADRLRREFATRGITLRFTLFDRAATHLPRNGASRVVGDALALPFADGSFDLVTCALFLHHLEPDAIVRFANEAQRVARVAFLVNDLRRSPVHLALAWAGTPLYRNRMSRHDTRASILRAYTPEELLSILRQCRARELELRNSYLYRMAAIAWK